MPRLDIRELGAIFVGGAAGAVLRVELSQAYLSAADSWPWIVFAINVSGAFILGYAVTRLQERLPLSTYRRPLIGTGFCGAYTTFSTMQLELLKMIDHGRYGLAAAYAATSIAAGYMALFTATAIVRRVRVVV
ncbi:MAG: fluoride efflux transporter CrcB [Solirubrobacteraceae bacterium]